jgi:hypothetical protein
LHGLGEGKKQEIIKVLQEKYQQKIIFLAQSM